MIISSLSHRAGSAANDFTKIAVARFKSKLANLTAVALCAPTLPSIRSIDNEFYDSLHAVVNRITKRNSASTTWQHTLAKERRLDYLIQQTVRSVVSYGSEKWPLMGGESRRLKIIEYRCPRSIWKVSWRDRIPSETDRNQRKIACPSVHL